MDRDYVVDNAVVRTLLTGVLLVFAASCTPPWIQPDETRSGPGVQDGDYVVVQGGIDGPATDGNWDAAVAEPNVQCGLDDVAHDDIGDNHSTTVPGQGWSHRQNPDTRRCGDDYETLLFRLANCEREARGMEPLRCDERLVWAGRAHSKDMHERDYFSHSTPEGKQPGDRLKDHGVNWRASAENIAIAPTMALAHTGWMESDGHRRNILRQEVDHMGIGVVRTDRGYVMTALYISEFK